MSWIFKKCCFCYLSYALVYLTYNCAERLHNSGYSIGISKAVKAISSFHQLQVVLYKCYDFLGILSFLSILS